MYSITHNQENAREKSEKSKESENSFIGLYDIDCVQHIIEYAPTYSPPAWCNITSSTISTPYTI